MNNKGFTLVELLAVVVILSLVGGIATVGVVGIINNSRIKGEDILKAKIAKSVEAYIDNTQLNGLTLTENGDSFTFTKCDKETCSNLEERSCIAKELTSVTLSEVISKTELFDSNIINPSTKKKLRNLENIKIHLYRDCDYVYYYYLDLNQYGKDNIVYSNTSNINNLPDNLFNDELKTIYESEIYNELNVYTRYRNKCYCSTRWRKINSNSSNPNPKLYCCGSNYSKSCNSYSSQYIKSSSCPSSVTSGSSKTVCNKTSHFSKYGTYYTVKCTRYSYSSSYSSSYVTDCNLCGSSSVSSWGSWSSETCASSTTKECQTCTAKDINECPN